MIFFSLITRIERRDASFETIFNMCVIPTPRICSHERTTRSSGASFCRLSQKRGREEEFSFLVVFVFSFLFSFTAVQTPRAFLFSIPFFFFLQLCHLLRLSSLSFYKLKALLLFSFLTKSQTPKHSIPAFDRLSLSLSLSKDILWLSFRFLPLYFQPARKKERNRERD